MYRAAVPIMNENAAQKLAVPQPKTVHGQIVADARARLVNGRDIGQRPVTRKRPGRTISTPFQGCDTAVSGSSCGQKRGRRTKAMTPGGSRCDHRTIWRSVKALKHSRAWAL
jgi:hypothetical protein